MTKHWRKFTQIPECKIYNLEKGEFRKNKEFFGFVFSRDGDSPYQKKVIDLHRLKDCTRGSLIPGQGTVQC